MCVFLTANYCQYDCLIIMLCFSNCDEVFGFAGASMSLASGRSLHYFVHLETCTEVTGSALAPEFTEPFGGYVTTYRSFNDRDISDIPFLVFFEQTMMLNSSGKITK